MPSASHPPSGAVDQYGVVGHPIAHSWSPFIHGLFARETGASMSYRLYDFTPEEFAQRVREFFRQGGRGLNVTLPHNLGDNTDGTGLVRDLCDNLGIAVTHRRVLIIGAGGAARGVLAPLLTLEPSEIVIANRTPERARSLAAACEKLVVVSAVGLEHISGRVFDLVINATAASLSGDVPAVPGTVLGPETVCYDMAYGKGDTAFVRWAHKHGCTRAVQGWGMLVEQAAESFRIWRGMRPSTAAVLAALRQHQRNVTSSSAMVG